MQIYDFTPQLDKVVRFVQAAFIVGITASNIVLKRCYPEAYRSTLYNIIVLVISILMFIGVFVLLFKVRAPRLWQIWMFVFGALCMAFCVAILIRIGWIPKP